MEKRKSNRTEEIDLVELSRTLWASRRFILRVTAVAAALGLLFALFGEVRYTAVSVIVPQTGRSATGGNLQGLAALAGINLGVAEQGDLISPLIYPMVVASVPFTKDLMHTPVMVAGHAEPVPLVDYFTSGGYRPFSLFAFLGRYTVGLPGLAMKAIRRGRDTAPSQTDAGEMETLTADEHECRQTLAGLVKVTVDEKNGYITLSATMPTALIAARVAARAQELLQSYITSYKLQKARSSLDFIEERYAEVKAGYDASLQALASFRDANRNLASAVARIRETSLQNEHDLAFALYSELARQREQAAIKVKEDTPVFTVVEPVTVPVRRSAPRRMAIMVVSVLAGLFVGAGWVLLKNYMTR